MNHTKEDIKFILDINNYLIMNENLEPQSKTNLLIRDYLTEKIMELDEENENENSFKKLANSVYSLILLSIVK